MTDAPLPTPDLLRGECVHGCEDVRARECDDCIRLALERAREIGESAARERVADWMTERSIPTGPGDTLDDLLGELFWELAPKRARKWQRS